MTVVCRRCDWTPEPDQGLSIDQLAEHAANSGHWLCLVCSTSLPADRPQTCLPCLASVRRDLSRIVELYALLPVALAGAVYGQPDAPRDGDSGGERSIPGGDRLTMLGPGALGPSGLSTPRRWVWLWSCRECAEVVEDRGAHLLRGHGSTAWSSAAERFDEAGGRWVEEEPSLEAGDDPPPVAYELGRWEDDWRLTRGEPAAEEIGTVAGAADYLGRRMSWAADHHGAFDEFARDLAKILSRLRTATATDDRPDRGAPCLSCGAVLERERADRRPGHGCVGHHDRCAWPHEPHGCTDTGGLVDEWKCPRCPRRYSAEEYAFVMRSRWANAVRERRQAIGWTVRELAADLGITESGVRQIVRRHEIARKGTGDRNAALYDPEEVRAAAGSLRACG